MVWNPHIDEGGVKAFDNPAYFEVDKIFEDSYGSTVLVKVREELKPNYNLEEIDWNATAAGYLISIISFLGFLQIYRSKNRAL
jgi:hypothetical protein